MLLYLNRIVLELKQVLQKHLGECLNGKGKERDVVKTDEERNSYKIQKILSALPETVTDS